MESTSDILDDATIGLAGWIGHSRGMASAHRHLDLEINYLLSGTISYLVGGNVVTLPPQRFCLLWGGVPHQMVRSARAAEMIWITIPLTSVLRWGLPDQLIRTLLATGFVADAAPRTSDLDLLHQWLEDLPGFDEVRREHQRNEIAEGVVLLEIEARLRRLAMSLPHPLQPASEPHINSPANSDGGLNAVEAMAQFIFRNFQNAISIAEIAQEAHLHPNYAMTIFRRHTGMTISQYLTLQRVAHAQRRLATSDDAIHAIATDSGFGSISRFYEAFQQHTGRSPRRFRMQMDAKA